MNIKRYNFNKRTSLKTKKTAKYRISESKLKEVICNLLYCKSNKHKSSRVHIGGAGDKLKIKK